MLYLLYLQPWVLHESWELPGIVPHITSLNKVENTTGTQDSCVYSYSEAWKRYISQNIVSRHAHRIIVQFMEACFGKSRTTDVMQDETDACTARDIPPNDVLLSQIHTLIDALGKSTSKLMSELCKIQTPNDRKQTSLMQLRKNQTPSKAYTDIFKSKRDSNCRT